MTAELVHRGPDEEGFHVDEKRRVYLGHRRLAIVDVADGHQPMWNETGDVGIVYNGEIYNHEELRRDLVARGHRFATGHSDTEVLVHGYEEWGTDLPLKLNGMFAFAIFDARRRQVFLARDRFGEKPLYYTQQRDLFAFASELTALVQHRAVDRTMSLLGIQKLLGYGYIPAPHSIVEGVRKLPGGHWLQYDLDSAQATVNRYWRFEVEPDHALGDADEPRLVEECRELLGQAARRRLMSDVPLGVFLSGGLDSSLVLASLAAAVAPSSLSSYTIGFDDPSYDESMFAQVVSRHVGNAHHERLLTLDRAKDLIPSLLARLDEPLGDASLLPTHLVSTFAREHVTVALSGDGGDELFAGYDPFVALRWAGLYEKLVPRWLHSGARRLADLLPRSSANMSLDFKVRRATMGLSWPASYRLPVWMAPLDPADLADIYEQPVRPEDIYSEAIDLWRRDDDKPTIDRALEFFTRFYLQDDILMKVDRAAMACSLETRAVFLDNDLVEFTRRLPARFKFRNGTRKYLLKKVAETLLPHDIVHRKKKGFGIPLARWLRELPEEAPFQPLPGLRLDYAEEAFSSHRSGDADNRLLMWTWMSLQAVSRRLGQQRSVAD